MIARYNLDEGAGLKAYDASGNGYHGDIILNGTAESAFHQSSQLGEIPSVQNSYGYRKIFDNNIIDVSTQAYHENGVFYDRTNVEKFTGKVDNWYDRMASAPRIGSSTTEKLIRLEVDVYCEKASQIRIQFNNGNEYHDIPAGQWYRLKSNDFRGVWSSGYWNFYHPDLLTGDTFYYDLDSVIWESAALIPRSLAIPDQDVLGGILTDAQKNRVRYEGDIVQNSIAYFDGNLYASIPFAAVPQTESFSVYVRCRTNSDDRGIITAGRSRGGYDDRDWGIFQNGTELMFTVDIDDVLVTASSGILLTQGVWYEVLAVYEGGVGLSLYVDGELKGTTATTGTRVIRKNVNIGGFDSWSFIGAIAHFKMWDSAIGVTDIDSETKWEYLFGESLGLWIYNVGKDRPADSDAAVMLSGSADDTQWSIDDSQTPFNLVRGFSAGLLFNGTDSRITFTEDDAYKIQDFELEITFAVTEVDAADSGVYRNVLMICGTTKHTYPYYGIIVEISQGTIEMHLTKDSGGAAGVIAGNITDTKKHTALFTKVGANMHAYLDGVPYGMATFNEQILYGEYPISVGISPVEGGDNFKGIIYNIRFDHTDTTGNVIARLLEFNGTYSSNTTVDNLAADGPTDGTWTIDEGHIVKVPADTLVTDVLGHRLTNISTGTIHNSAESSVLLNPNYAPELIELGIDETTTVP